MDLSKGKARSCNNSEEIRTTTTKDIHISLIIINQGKKDFPTSRNSMFKNWLIIVNLNFITASRAQLLLGFSHSQSHKEKAFSDDSQIKKQNLFIKQLRL